MTLKSFEKCVRSLVDGEAAIRAKCDSLESRMQVRLGHYCESQMSRHTMHFVRCIVVLEATLALIVIYVPLPNDPLQLVTNGNNDQEVVNGAESSSNLSAQPGREVPAKVDYTDEELLSAFQAWLPKGLSAMSDKVRRLEGHIFLTSHIQGCKCHRRRFRLLCILPFQSRGMTVEQARDVFLAELGIDVPEAQKARFQRTDCAF